MTGRLLGLVSGDVANLRRDPMLTAAALAPVLIGGLARLALPIAETALAEWVAVDTRLVLGVALLLVPLLVGFALGFLLVEEREERILAAVAVSPRGTSGFLAYRLAVPVMVGGLATPLVATLSGMAVPAGRLVGISLLCGVAAALLALGLAVASADRVQGLVWAKLSGFTLVGAVAFQALADPWRWLFAPLPQTWILEAAVTSSSPLPAMAAGLGVSALWGVVAWHRLPRL